MILCHKSIQKNQQECCCCLSFGRWLGIGPRLDITSGETSPKGSPTWDKFPKGGRALGSWPLLLWHVSAQTTVSCKRDLTRECFTRPIFTTRATSKAMQLKACLHLLENQSVLTICSSSTCTDLLVMLGVTLYAVFNDFMGIWENVQSFTAEILHFGLGTNTSNLVLYKTDGELVPHPFYSSKNYSHHNKVAGEFMIIYSKWKQNASGIPSLVLAILLQASRLLWNALWAIAHKCLPGLFSCFDLPRKQK